MNATEFDEPRRKGRRQLGRKKSGRKGWKNRPTDDVENLKLTRKTRREDKQNWREYLMDEEETELDGA